ncbi:cysteine hydrolase family protein, partial [Staphylococcus warneri]
IEIVGVCTDICILHTAVSAYNLGYNITIPIRGVASFNQDGHQWALSHFKNSLGAKVED